MGREMLRFAQHDKKKGSELAMLARKPFIIAICFVFIVMLIAGILFNFSIADTSGVAFLPVQSYSRINSNNSAPAIPAHKNNTLLSMADVEEYVLTHRCSIGPTV